MGSGRRHSSPKRRAFLIRIDSKVLERVESRAQIELRSVNAQIEYLLRQALEQSATEGAEKTRTTPSIWR